MSNVIHKAELMERIENDLAFLADTLEVYNESYPQLISQMRQAVSDKDNKDLAGAAHTLKGLFSNFAAYPAIEAALKLQMMAKQGHLSGAEQALDELENESNRLKAALEDMLEG